MDQPLKSAQGKVQSGPVLRKSRSGCRTCKIRRVKCDERKPTCSSCSRRFVAAGACDYGSTAPRRKMCRQGHQQPQDNLKVPNRPKPSSVVLPCPSSTSISVCPPSASEAPSWRQWELKLMHHYATVVAETLPICHGQKAYSLWHQTTPQFAFSSEVVLNPMLALSALHLHVHNQNDRVAALAVARYLDKSLVIQREALELLDTDMGEQVWVASMILAHLYWLYAHYQPHGDHYELPFRAWDMLTCIQELLQHKYVTLVRLGYSRCCFQYWPEVATSEDLADQPEFALYRSIEAEITQLGVDFGVDKGGLLPEVQETYKAFQDEILVMYRAFFTGYPAKVLRRWIGLLVPKHGQTLRKLLAKYDPLAMALFVRALCLLRGFEEIWWMNGQGMYDVVERSILGVSELIPEELQFCMEWPKKVLSGKVELLRTEKPLSALDKEQLWYNA